MAENGRNQMWILICEYGIPEYRDSINLQGSRRPAQSKAHRITLRSQRQKR